MKYRFKRWSELTPFQQGYAIGCMKVYGLVGGIFLGAWIFNISVLDTIRNFIS